MARILIVEDNADLVFGLRVFGLRNNLEFEGYEVEAACDGSDGLERALSGECDLIILDLMLPQLDGFQLLRRIREQGITTPVLVLSARAEQADKARALRAGADDYLTKPFDLGELLARLEALLRRSKLAAQSDARAGSQPRLTKRESEILSLLGAGLSNKAIAARLHIKPATVKAHVHSILGKPHLHGRADIAVAKAAALRTNPGDVPPLPE